MVLISTTQGKQGLHFYLMINKTKNNIAGIIVIYYSHQIYKNFCLVDADIQVTCKKVRNTRLILNLLFNTFDLSI